MNNPSGGGASGFVLVDKPAGITSFQALFPLKRLFGTRRAGHAGTLDQEASGLLVAAVGRATRLLPWIEGQDKHYTFTLHLGRETDTCEFIGETVSGDLSRVPSTADLEVCLQKFRGAIAQVPPGYSAVKIDGKRASDILRKGGEVELKPRQVLVHALELLQQTSPTSWTMRCHCSKGTYIRSLARDIGREFGCGGCSWEIRRTAIGEIQVEKACAPLALTSDALVMPKDVFSWPIVDIEESANARVANGNYIRMTPIAEPGTLVFLRPAGTTEPTHLAEWDALGRLQPKLRLDGDGKE